MTRFVAALAACLVLFTPVFALAQPAVVPNYVNPSGTSVPGKADASGIPRVTEEYPHPYQTFNEVLYNSTAAAGISGGENLSAAVWSSAHLYPIKALRIRVDAHTIGAAGVNGPLIVRVRGSFDGVNYAHVGLNSSSADSVSGDTLQFKIWAGVETTPIVSPNGRWYKLAYGDGTPLPFPYLQFAIINRGSATDSVAIEAVGRMQ